MRISYFFSSFLSIYERPNLCKKKINPKKEKAARDTVHSGKVFNQSASTVIPKIINIPEAIMKAMVKLNILYIIIGNISAFLVNKM